jgi:flagellar biosynthesis protein FlhG
MSSEDYSKHLETLELEPGASLSEVRKAYQHLKALYSRESIVTVPIEDEISPEAKKQILRQIEEAYKALLISFEEEEYKGKNEMSSQPAMKIYEQTSVEHTTFTGQALRKIREGLNIDLQDIALSTRVQTQYLKDIELENFETLPPETYTRGFVISYAEYLSLDSKKVADDYMSRYAAWKDEHEKKK